MDFQHAKHPHYLITATAASAALFVTAGGMPERAEASMILEPKMPASAQPVVSFSEKC